MPPGGFSLSRRLSFGAQLGTSSQILSAKPIKASNRSSQDICIDIIFLHGWKGQRFERPLERFASTVVDRVGQCRMHFLSFDGAKLLRKGKPFLEELVKRLIEYVVKIKGRKRVAVIAHSIAAWVVREALVQSQYATGLDNVPVGLVDFGIPKNFDSWGLEAWKSFRDGLLVDLMNGQPKITAKRMHNPSQPAGDEQQEECTVERLHLDSKEVTKCKTGAVHIRHSPEGLDFATIDCITQTFDDFRDRLGSPETDLPIRLVLPSGGKIVGPTSTLVLERVTSNTSMDHQSYLSDLGMTPEEEKGVIDFLSQVSKAPCVSIPTPPSSPRQGREVGKTTIPIANPRQHGSPYEIGSKHGPSTVPMRHPDLVDALPIPNSQTTSFITSDPQKLQQTPPHIEEQVTWQTEAVTQERVQPWMNAESSGKSGTSPLRQMNTTAELNSHEKPREEFEPAISTKITEPEPDSLDIKDAKKMAYWYFQNGDLDEAEHLYNTLIKWCTQNDCLDRSYYRMELQIARIAFIRGCYKVSEERLLKLQTQQYRTPSWKQQKGETLLVIEITQWLSLSQWRQGRYATAQQTILQCRGQLPRRYRSNQDLLSTFALVLASLGYLDQAWRVSNAAVNSLTPIHRNSDEFPAEDAIAGRKDSYRANHARILYLMGDLKGAEEKNNIVLHDRNSRLGPTHLATLEALAFQSRLFLATSKTSQASDSVRRTLRDMIERMHMAERHPSTLQTLEVLVLVLKGEGRYSDAETTAKYLLDMNEHVLEKAHPQTLKSKTILAEIFHACGKLEDAERVQEEVLIEEKSADEIDYPGRFFYNTTLANILRGQGKWDKARETSLKTLLEQLQRFQSPENSDEAYQSDALSDEQHPQIEFIPMATLRTLLQNNKAIMEQLNALSTDLQQTIKDDAKPVKSYPSIVQTLHCLALCEQVRDDADLNFTQGILEIVRKIRLDRLHEDNWLAVNVQLDIAVNYRLRAMFHESLTVIKDVVKKRQHSFDADHPEYLAARHQEAVTLFRLGHWKEALQIQTDTLTAQEILLGTAHPDTVLSRYTLGGIYHSIGRLEDANRLLCQVIEQQKGRYHENHPIILRSMARHALIRLDMGDIQGAKEEQEFVINERKKYLPQGHSLIRYARSYFAQILQADGCHEEALEIYQDLSGSVVSPNVLGFEVRTNMGSCYFDLKRYQDAENTQRELRKDMKASKAPNADAIANTFNLALTVHHSTDKAKEACELLEEAFRLAEEVLGKDHVQTKELEATLRNWQG